MPNAFDGSQQALGVWSVLLVLEERKASALEPQACLQDLSGIGVEPTHQTKTQIAARQVGATQRASCDQSSVVDGFYD